MKPSLTDPSHHFYSIEIDGAQRQEIIAKKGYKDTPEYSADPRIRRFLQGIVNKDLKLNL